MPVLRDAIAKASKPPQRRCINCGLLAVGDGKTVAKSDRTPKSVAYLVRQHTTVINVPFSCFVSAYSLAAEHDPYIDAKSQEEYDARLPTAESDAWWRVLIAPRECASFDRQVPGLSCADHLARTQRAAERREERLWNVLATLLSAVVGGGLALIGVLIANAR
jgi:hypothetical protein